MKCVNTRHKGFKYLAERNNLSVETLEQITHKYWIENKTDEYFPTDIYIQAQLGKIPYQESGENVIKLWERDYKEPKTFKSFEELEEARTEALRFFPEMAVTYHKGYNGDYVLTIRKPLKNLKISAKDLLDKETLNSQERSDFKLVTKDSADEGINVEQFAIDINNKKPQMFTFKDGVSVRAPFKPNYQQEDALNAMDDFVKSSKHVFTLSGYAGTGKTSIIEILAQKMKKEHIPVLFCASTNKAAAVLNERVSKSGFTAQTLNKIFGISVEVDPTKSYNANNLVNKLRDVELPYGATVIIDEASMIDEENYGILNEIAARNELKIIYVGDAAQLAPPKDNKLSKVFRDQSHDIKTLTLVERTGDNAILKEATDIRNGKPLSGKSSFNDKGQGVAYIKADNTKRKDDLIKAFVPRLQEDPDYFRILAYSNRQVSAYNTQVRRLLGYNDNIPRVNEPIVGYTNWGYIKGGRNGRSYEFVNSEAYKVTEVQQPRTITTNLPEVGKVTLEVIPTVLEDSFGKKRLINLIDVKGNPANRETALKLATTKSDLWNRANRLPKGSVKSALQDAANAIERFLFVNDDLGGTKGKPYQKKVFDFGYAMTVHKSQGSTFKNVLIDDVDIVNTIKNSEDAKSKQYIPYTDASTPSEIDFSNSEITSTSDVDLGDWANAVEDNTLMTPYPKKDSSMNNKQALLRQQLEYVAVSRASDTATVISDEVVKEDSPLNHLKDAIKAEATENVRSMTSDEVWKAAAEIEAPSTERTVEYRDQTYTIRGNHIYNKDGKEVYSKDASNVGKDRNIILAKLAEVDERAVKVNHNNRTYYVDNKKNIISETSGMIMKWGEENGDRKAVLALAEQEFRDMIEPDLISGQIDELMEKAGIPYFNEEDMERYFQEHNDIQMFIGKKARTQFEQSLKKARPDMSDAEIKSTLDFLHSLEDNKENTAYIKTAVRWIANRSITLPQDNTKARQAFDLARKKNLDLQRYKTLGELITSPEMQPKEKEKASFNPDKAKTFSNKRTVTTEGGRIFTVYDVENTEEGQREVCKALAAHYATSPWCLSTFTATGEPTQSAKKYWDHYNSLPRKIAFENGKPVAFSSDNMDRKGQSHRMTGTELEEYRNLINKVSQYEQQRPKLTRRNSNDRENIIKQQEQFDKANPEYVTLKAELDNIINRIERSDENGTYIYDRVSEQTEAWWDMEDRYPQDTLSDSIISDLNSKEALRNTAEIAAENLGLLGRQDEIDTLVEMQQQHIPLTETNYRNFRQQQEERYEYNIEANERELLLAYEREGFPEPVNPNQEEIYSLPFFKTPEGEVYGFVDADGNMYIDRRVAKPEHRIHEYTHLWDRMVISREPELWKKGVDLMQQFDNGSLWNEILNSEQYGKKWQENGITGEQLNNLAASEVHARLVGKNGEALLKEVARKRGQKSIINKLKQWMLDVWKSLKATFSNWKPEDVKELTLEDFNQMTLRDFADGLNFGKYTPMLTSKTTESTETGLIENTTNQLRDYYKWQRDHVSFDKGSHTYYVNGKSVDFSVTEYKDFVYGKPDIKGDYTHSTTIGDAVDELTRDFFTPNSKWEEKEYHNLNDSRKQEIVKHLRRFKEYLDKTYKDKEGKPNYKVITSEIPLIGEITVNGERKTVAGTPDMIVIDGNGDVHIYDMKVKTNNIEDWNNRRDYTFQLNAYRQLIESILPELAGKIKDLQLIWFNTKYPKQGKEATFVTSKTGIITVSDDVVKNMPLAEYEKWTTPSLKQDVKESIIPLDKKDVLSEVSPYDVEWKESLKPVEAPLVENTINKQQPVQQSLHFEYARNANGRPNYEVSSRGDKRFSAMTATFAPGTKLLGHDVGGRTIESVYQHGVKQGDWVTDNNTKTGAPKDKTIIKGNTEDDSYAQGYLPLWQEWARQNPLLIEELRQAAQGKVITDMFASTAVSQARAFADILNSTSREDNLKSDEALAQTFGVTREQVREARATQLRRIQDIQGWIDSLEEKAKRNKATQKELNDLNEYRNKLSEEQALYDGLTVSGESEIYINEYGIPLVRKKQKTAKSTQFVNHSGGAIGSDTYWGKVGERYSVKSNHYYHGQKTPKGNTEISQQDYEEGKREVAKAATYNYGYPYSTMKNDLLIRNWSQVKYADAIFAIGHLVKPGEKLFPDVSSDTRVAKNATVTGGTGYAVAMAILHNKPVYVFDQERNQWYKNTNGKWSESEVPVLTPNFAGIGTRNINEAGKKAIEEIYAKTFSNQQQDSTDSLEQNVTPEDEKPMISLPNYASWMGQESFEVEQDWKAERLLELDGQLANTEIPFDVKEKIKKDIEKTLDAVNEEDLYTALSKRDAKKLQEKQGRLAELNRSINRLQNSSILTPSDIHGAAKQIMDNISDMITRIQDEPSIVETWFPSLELQDDVDFTTMTRKEIVETIGIGRFLEAAKKSIDSSEVDYDDVKTEMQADLFVENWNALIQFGNSYFKINEGYGIQLNLTTGEHKTTEGQIIDSDDFNADSDPDRNFENIKDEQEHWQIEQKAIDIMNSSEADLIKTALHNCYEMDENGQPVLSKWGKGKVHVDKRKAITSILSWVQGELTIKDMYNKLAEKQVKNPWLSGILDKLNPNDPETAYKNSKLQSLFFNVMCRSFQRYSFVQLQDGRYVAKPLNDHPAQTQVIKTIEALFNINEHPLFQYTNGNGNVIKGINIKLLGKAGDSKTDRFTLHSAFEELSDIKDRLEKGETFSAEMSEQAKNNILGVCKILGFVPENPVLNTAISTSNVKYMTDKLKFIVQSLDDAYKKEQENLNKPNAAPYEPFKFKGDLSIEGSVRNFFNPITNAMEEIMPNVVYDDGKLYQAYVTPSFLSLLMQKFHWDTDKFNDFIEKQYGYSEWFKTKDGYWRNDMLRRMATDEKARKAFSHTVELNLNNHRYMKNLSDIEYAVSLFAHYWGENTRKGDTNPIAWFRMPMQSNKPSSEFFSFYSYRGANYKKNIVDGGLSREEMLSGAGGGLYGTFLQEMERIKTVLMRNKEEGDPDYIQNFDKFGKYFNFLVFLNPYLASGKAEERNLLEETTEYKEKNGITKNENLAKLIQKRLEGEKAMSGEELLEMGNLAREAIRNALEKKAQKILDNWEETGILDAAKKVSYIANEIKDIKDEDTKNAAVRELLENFIWNDHFAAINILQLTIGDIAFYKNAEDLQKRLSQLHAPGIRPNVFAVVDNKGTRASDGRYRTLLIKDYDSFITNIIQNLEEVFDRRIANAKTAEEKKGWEMLKEDLVGPDGKYRKINVTDAQGYNSPTSYRKKAIMFGRWSSEAEEIYQKLARGDKNLDNVRTAFQPLKPFVYTQLHKDIGVRSKSEDGTSIESPIQHMPVPFQAKNSEYLLIMADALLKGEELSRPNLLRAIFRVMEDSAYDNREYDEYGRITKMGDYNGRGIDTIQFESAIKSGKQGVIDLNQFIEQPEGEESAYTFMMNQIYQRNDKGELTREYNTKTFIHETDFESYCLQQDVPGHFRNHYQAQGSQERMIIPSDLEYYKNPTLTVEEGLDNEDNINYYGKYKADEIRKEIENVTAANINLSIKEFKERLKWDSASEAEKNMALSEILQEEILDSTRYGIDMFLACGLDENGEFRIPLGDPIQAKRIEQLLNSIIKNSINKQEIAGGPIVQVSNYGVSRQLQIKFHDKNGGILLTKEEFEAKKNTKAYEKYKSYDDYKHENQAGIAYFEVFAPAWMRSLFKYFTDAYGNIDLETLEILNPDLLKMISYRIPTEDKYSIAPMKLVGFMPKEAGDALMLPYEITEIDDSDFDIDKRYVMRKVINIEPMFEVAKGETFGKALDRYIKENKSNLIDNIIRDTNIKETLSKEEKQEITEGIGKSIELEKRTAERTHQENLAVIETRYEQLDDANAATTWDKDAEKDDKIYEQKSVRQDRSHQREIDRENKRYEAQLKKIEERRKEKEEREQAKAIGRKIRQQVSDFLYLKSGKFYSPAGADDANTRAIRTAFLKQIFKLNDAPDQRTVNNNKIIDLTWDVLTNEKTASMILNPGGYDNFKKNCYMILNFQDLAKDIHDPEKLVELWNELKGKKIDELKSAIKTNNDLTWVDTQLQFYRQNSAAASLLGRFAIEKIAHAILEGNGIFVNVKEICGIESFSIAGFTFGGKRSKTGKALLSAEDFSEDKKLSNEMTYEEYLLKNDYDPTLDNMTELDPTYSSNGFFVGKSLGSGVSASADAGKEDALSPVNINKNTINAFTSSLRFGMPHDISELFMAQKVIKEVLTEYVRSSIEDHKSLDEIIDNKLNAFEKEYGESSMLKNGKLSEAELLEGMLDREHKEVDYKVLYIFDKLKKLAEEVKKPTLITRFNSISNAVGPLIVDNLVMRHRMDDMDVSNINDIHFYKRAEDGTMAKVTMDTIFEDHPILKAFAETVGIAETLFRRMPAGSSGFKTLLDQMPSILSEKISQRIWNDKGLLNDLSNFYQSYLIIQAGLIKDTELKEFIEDFPKTFEKEYKKKYGNNAFVNAVMMSTSEKTSRTFLNIPQTGFDETVKDVYRSDMIELYKENPKLVWDLFKYAFFRGGINFSPKTWMNLVSTFIKERLETVNQEGKRVSYKDVYNYKTFPTVNPKTLLDQFVRNNWNDTKLVPRKKLEDTKYEIGNNNALLTVTDASEIAELSGIAYLKTVDEKKNAYLWRLLGKEEDNKEHRLYGRISPLGDNGEYLEMFRDTSTNKDNMDVLRRKPMTETTKESDKAASEGDLENSTLIEGETDGRAPRRELTDKEKVKNIEDFGEGILMQWQGTVNRNKTRADALKKANEIIGEVKNTGKLQKGMKTFISLALAKKGVVVSEEKVIEKLRELNLCD